MKLRKLRKTQRWHRFSVVGIEKQERLISAEVDHFVKSSLTTVSLFLVFTLFLLRVPHRLSLRCCSPKLWSDHLIPCHIFEVHSLTRMPLGHTCSSRCCYTESWLWFSNMLLIVETFPCTCSEVEFGNWWCLIDFLICAAGKLIGWSDGLLPSSLAVQ